MALRLLCIVRVLTEAQRSRVARIKASMWSRYRSNAWRHSREPRRALGDAIDGVQQHLRLQSLGVKACEAAATTEIGNLNEVIVSEGRRFNIPTPYKEAVSSLTRSVEERNRQKLSGIQSTLEPDVVRTAIKEENLEALRRADTDHVEVDDDAPYDPLQS